MKFWLWTALLLALACVAIPLLIAWLEYWAVRRQARRDREP